MPNWCHNTLRVSGDPEQVQDFVEAVQDPEQGVPLSFDSLVPEPPGLADRPDLGLAGLIDPSIPDQQLDWYAWRVRRWGTKWEPNFDQPATAMLTQPAAASGEEPAAPGGLILFEDQAYFSFLTAWSPPLPWLQTVAQQWPQLELELHWAEPGSQGAGRANLQGDQLELEELTVEEVLAPQDRWF